MSAVILFGTAEGADVTLCPEAPAACATEALLEFEGEAPVAALRAPETASGAVLEEFATDELPKPESPEVPKPLVVPEALSEKEAAEGADELPNPTGWRTLGEDATPNAGLEAAAELPKAGAFPDGTLGFALQEKLLAPLLLFAGKPEIMRNVQEHLEWVHLRHWNTAAFQ